MHIAVIGQGYVGLTAAICLVESGHIVTGVEVDRARLTLLEQSRLPFFEPGLGELLQMLARAGNLQFRPSLQAVAGRIDAVLIAVGSPQLASGAADLQQVAAAIEETLALRPLPDLVIIKSTIPPGTSERLLAEANGDGSLRDRYVYSPEFLSQGTALADWRRPSRLVVGLKNESLLPALRDLYGGVAGSWVVTTPTDAEMIKYASNAFLAMKISFVNEMANVCEVIGADIEHVVDGLALDPRIGGAHLRAGVGFGGSCLPKDVVALAHLAAQKAVATPMMEAIMATNAAQRARVVHRVCQPLEGLNQASVGVLGLSFKPDTDDLREAPSLTVVPELLAAGLRVRVWDPVVSGAKVAETFPGAVHAKSPESAADGASALVVLTEWQQVIDAPWERIASRMAAPRLLLDGRNCLDATAMRAAGFRYQDIGRA